ncbi:MAG: AMP-binding protein [Geminicoccaceae bacterium]
MASRRLHRNIQANLEGAYDLLSHIGIGDREIFLSFLPLSHSYEHTAGQFFPISLGAEIYYAEGVETLSTNPAEARPTILTCVPRLYEVLRQKILAGVNRQGGHRKSGCSSRRSGSAPGATSRAAASACSMPSPTCCSSGWSGPRSTSASAAGSRR